ncbi:hypothetical protein [Niveispirillum lacus]|nr:hypothetical protein [Niveispirillum lacus]
MPKARLGRLPKARLGRLPTARFDTWPLLALARPRLVFDLDLRL